MNSISNFGFWAPEKLSFLFNLHTRNGCFSTSILPEKAEEQCSELFGLELYKKISVINKQINIFSQTTAAVVLFMTKC